MISLPVLPSQRNLIISWQYDILRGSGRSRYWSLETLLLILGSYLTGVCFLFAVCIVPTVPITFSLTGKLKLKTQGNWLIRSRYSIRVLVCPILYQPLPQGPKLHKYPPDMQAGFNFICISTPTVVDGMVKTLPVQVFSLREGPLSPFETYQPFSRGQQLPYIRN